MSLKNYVLSRIVSVLPRREISALVGYLSTVVLPEKVMGAIISAYIKAFHVNMSDAQETRFNTFDDFFTRRLKPGARPVGDDPQVLVSPCDGNVVSGGGIGGDTKMMIKGKEYTLCELLGDATWAGDFAGGKHMVIYLSPGDYHRVHSPTDGKLRAAYLIDGDRLPVNDIGTERFKDVFSKNKRVVLEVDSPEWGSIAIVLVGAFIVGRIEVDGVGDWTAHPHSTCVFDPPRSLKKGDDLGAFHLGSTVIIVVQKGKELDDTMSGKIAMGERISR